MAALTVSGLARSASRRQTATMAQMKGTKSRDVLIPPSECQSAAIGELDAYWTELRGARPFPSRHDIDPARIKRLLPNIALLDVFQDPLRLRYRLAGTRFVEAFGAETSGRWLDEVYDDEFELNQTLENFRHLLAARAPIFGRTENTFLPIGTSRFLWAIFPLSDDGTTITHALGIEDYSVFRK